MNKKEEKLKKKQAKIARKSKKENTRTDLGRIAVKVIAAILAFIMVLAVAATLIYYI